jgi:hypothetical protein
MAPILFHGLSQLGFPVIRVESRQSYLFSPGIFWSGLIVNRCGCGVQALQMHS